jgi:hypothetical protein
MARVPSGRPITSTGTSERLLVVRLAKEEPTPRSRRLLAAILVSAIIVIVYACLEAFYHLPESTPLLSFKDAPVAVNARLRYPEFASVGDASYIEVTVVNAGNEPITGTLVIVLDQDASVSLLPDNQAGLAFTDLAPGDRTSHRLEFRPVGPWSLPVDDSLAFHLLLLFPDGQKYESDDKKIGLMPLPYLNWVLTALRGGFLASLAALFWERIKKWLFP